MLKFSVHLSSSESDLRTDDLSDDTSSGYSNSLKDGHHNCQECEKRKRALSKERARLSRDHSRSRERLNSNNNGSISDSNTPSVTSNGGYTSDGQDSVTCTTSTSNSENTTVSKSLYKRWQLRSRSKSKDSSSSKHGRRTESPDTSSNSNQSYDEYERHGRRGLWELQKAASRMVGPESRVGRWVGKLRSRSSEARIGSLKNKYSDIPRWGGWKLEDDDSSPLEDRLLRPTLKINERPFYERETKQPILGKKILRSRSTDAINQTTEKEHEPQNFRRKVHVRESFEKAMRNKQHLGPSDNVSKPRLHAMFESEPNLVKGNIYNVQNKHNEPRRYRESDDNHNCNYTQNMRRCTSQNLDIPYTQRNDHKRQQRHQNRQYNRNSRSAERGRDRPVSYHFDNSPSPTHRLYQKNQRLNQTSSLPRKSHRRNRQSPESQSGVCRKEKGQCSSCQHIRYEELRFVSSNTDYHHKDQRNRNGDLYQRDTRAEDYNTRYRERDCRRIDEKPVLARYIPPKVSSSEGYAKQCLVKRVPVQSVIAKRSSTNPYATRNNTHVKSSVSCGALNEIQTDNNLKRFSSEQELKRRSLTSLNSVESSDSGTSFSDGGRLSPCSDTNCKCSRSRNRAERSQSNVSTYSSDSGYLSPTSATNKDLPYLETNRSFGQPESGSKKHVVHTSDYESEPCCDNRPYSQRTRCQPSEMRYKTTGRLQDDDENQCDVKQQKSRRSPNMSKSNDSRSDPQSNFRASIDAEISNFKPTTTVRARLNHKAKSSAEMSVRRGDTLYFNRNNLVDGVRWVLAYSTSTGDTGLVPTVVLSSRMENLV